MAVLSELTTFYSIWNRIFNYGVLEWGFMDEMGGVDLDACV